MSHLGPFPNSSSNITNKCTSTRVPASRRAWRGTSIPPAILSPGPPHGRGLVCLGWGMLADAGGVVFLRDVPKPQNCGFLRQNRVFPDTCQLRGPHNSELTYCPRDTSLEERKSIPPNGHYPNTLLHFNNGCPMGHMHSWDHLGWGGGVSSQPYSVLHMMASESVKHAAQICEFIKQSWNTEPPQHPIPGQEVPASPVMAQSSGSESSQPGRCRRQIQPCELVIHLHRPASLLGNARSTPAHTLTR